MLKYYYKPPNIKYKPYLFKSNYPTISNKIPLWKNSIIHNVLVPSKSNTNTLSSLEMLFFPLLGVAFLAGYHFHLLISKNIS